MPGSPGGGFSPYPETFPAPAGVGHPGRIQVFPPRPPGPSDEPRPPHGITPKLIDELAAPSYIVGRVRINSSSWTSIPVDRPTIALAIQTDTQGTGPRIFYNYDQIPLGLGLGGTYTLAAQMSEGGIVFLSGPGKWWLLADSGFSPIDLILVDAFNPALAAKYLQQQAASLAVQTNVALSTTASSVIIANRRRAALTIQNQSGSGNVRLCFGSSPPATYLGLGSGILLPPTASITFQGTTLMRGDVFGVSSTTNNVEVVEYIM